jgi:hypothetical protein
MSRDQHCKLDVDDDDDEDDDDDDATPRQQGFK